VEKIMIHRIGKRKYKGNGRVVPTSTSRINEKSFIAGLTVDAIHRHNPTPNPSSNMEKSAKLIENRLSILD
jgi:hypothetical protein